MPKIETITLALPLRTGRVNCYLIEAGSGFVLIDTGGSNRRAELVKALEDAGCRPGDLRLIILTHGDFDHSGNAAFLRSKYGAKVGMHRDDVGMVERADMSWNRESGGWLFRTITSLLFRFGRSDRFSPDVLLEDGDPLSAYGLDAQVIHVPGHSKGSIGILAASAELFCGDLLENTREPVLNAIMDDAAAGNASVEKLGNYRIDTVYPGHGSPFPIDLLSETRRDND